MNPVGVAAALVRQLEKSNRCRDPMKSHLILEGSCGRLDGDASTRWQSFVGGEAKEGF
jgi:hypothetical protein